MPIPAELKLLITQVRQQHPQLKDTPDEAVAQLIMQALAARQGPTVPRNPDEARLEEMSGKELSLSGQRFLSRGQ